MSNEKSKRLRKHPWEYNLIRNGTFTWLNTFYIVLTRTYRYGKLGSFVNTVEYLAKWGGGGGKEEGGGKFTCGNGTSRKKWISTNPILGESGLKWFCCCVCVCSWFSCVEKSLICGLISCLCLCAVSQKPPKLSLWKCDFFLRLNFISYENIEFLSYKLYTNK